MEDFPSNSNQSRGEPKAAPKPEKEPLKKVVQGDVVRRKTPLGKRLKETFVGGDARSVWAYVVMDVLIPAAKDMVADALTTGVERTLFGEGRSGRSRSRGRSSGNNGYVAYNRFTGGGRPPFDPDPPRREISRRGRSSHDFDEIVLDSRGDAEGVIDALFELISRYDQATVADLYELVGISGNFTDEKWGWTDIRGAVPTRVRNGYLLELPRPEPLS